MRSVVNAALILTLIGIGLSGIGNYRPELVAGLLRFYWFRLADALVPLGVALWIVGLAARFSEHRPGWRWAAWLAFLAFAGWQLAPQLSSRFVAEVPRADKPGKVANYADWRDACTWIAANAPPDARFLRRARPRHSSGTRHAAKWPPGRIYRRTPRSIVAWRQRLADVYGTGDAEEPWYDSLAETPTDRLLQAAKKYNADHILTESQPPLDFPCLYRNETYAVYSLPQEGP